MGSAINVLITGVGGRSVGHQILQAMELVKDRYRVVAADAMDFAYGLYQTERRYLLPPAASPDYLPDVERLVKCEQISVILPGTQPETDVLAANAERFGDVRVIANPHGVIRLCRDKQVLLEWLGENGFVIPRSARDGMAENCRDKRVSAGG